MKVIFISLVVTMLTQATLAATQTIQSGAVISSEYSRTMTFNGEYFGYSKNKKSVLLRLKNSNYSIKTEQFFAVPFDGFELLDVMAKHPLKGFDKLSVVAKCKDANHIIIRMERGAGPSVYASSCKIVSLTITTPDSLPNNPPELRPQPLPPVAPPIAVKPILPTSPVVPVLKSSALSYQPNFSTDSRASKNLYFEN